LRFAEKYGHFPEKSGPNTTIIDYLFLAINKTLPECWKADGSLRAQSLNATGGSKLLRDNNQFSGVLLQDWPTRSSEMHFWNSTSIISGQVS
jgi:hypothetical protein